MYYKDAKYVHIRDFSSFFSSSTGLFSSASSVAVKAGTEGTKAVGEVASAAAVGLGSSATISFSVSTTGSDSGSGSVFLGAPPVFFKPGKPPANKLPIPPCLTPKAANLKPPLAMELKI